MNLDKLVDAETFAACEFLRVVKGLGVRERWVEADLGELEDKLEQWVGAREIRVRTEDAIAMARRMNGEH